MKLGGRIAEVAALLLLCSAYCVNAGEGACCGVFSFQAERWAGGEQPTYGYRRYVACTPYP